MSCSPIRRTSSGRASCSTPVQIYRESDRWERQCGLTQVTVPGFACWVHRDDGTFDKVKVIATGQRAGETTWLGHYTAGGTRLDDMALSAESA